jgi:hypothetical protein
MGTPTEVAKSVGAVIALVVLVGFGILLVSSRSASLILGYALLAGFLALVAWAVVKVVRER